MDHTREPFFASPFNRSVLDEAQLEALLRQTIAEHVAGVSPSPNALSRLNARLDAARPLKRWPVPLRLAGAVAAALLLFAFLTPVGRLAAASAHGAAQTIITTVKQIASGDSGASNTPPDAPGATGALGSRTAPTNGAGSPATGGTATPTPATRAGTPGGTAGQVAPLPPTPTPRATAQPTGTPPVVHTRLEHTPPAAPTPSSTATKAAAASAPPRTTVNEAATPVNQTDTPAAKPSALLTATPVTHGPKAVAPPGRDPSQDADKNRGKQCATPADASPACRKNAPHPHK